LAAGRAATTSEDHQRQLLDQEGLDHFRAVLAIPGHQDDLGALELIAHQTARMDRRSQQAVTAYNNLIAALQARPESPFRNLLLARAKRGLAILRYPTAGGTAQTLLTEAIRLLTQFGPPRDRDFLELAETCYLDGIARLRLEHVDKGPEQLGLAQGHYRDLIRSLDRRRPSLFKWMLGNRRHSGHRVAELRARAAKGLAEVDRLIKLNDKDQSLLIASLRTGRGVPSHNCMPPH
jgi:hypothetical protein